MVLDASPEEFPARRSHEETAAWDLDRRDDRLAQPQQDHRSRPGPYCIFSLRPGNTIDWRTRLQSLDATSAAKTTKNRDS